ncbi:MAG: hypothetical protein AVDCRST_MAG88-857, partial [uncultured Thermomicrobiales bacterium]
GIRQACVRLDLRDAVDRRRP